MLLILSFYSTLSALKCKRLKFIKEFLNSLETARKSGYQLILEEVSSKLILFSKQVLKILPGFSMCPQTFKVEEEISGYMSTLITESFI